MPQEKRLEVLLTNLARLWFGTLSTLTFTQTDHLVFLLPNGSMSMTATSGSILGMLLCKRTTFYHFRQDLKLEQYQNVWATQLEPHVKLSILILSITHQVWSKAQKGIKVTKKLKKRKKKV